jgi:stage V sporulation protein SpoVS
MHEKTRYIGDDETYLDDEQLGVPSRQPTLDQPLVASTSTPTQKLAAAVFARVKANGNTEIVSVGPQALSQAVKAVAAAAKMLQPKWRLLCEPEFRTVAPRKNQRRSYDSDSVSAVVLRVWRQENQE